VLRGGSPQQARIRSARFSRRYPLCVSVDSIRTTSPRHRIFNIARLRNLLRKRDNEFNFIANFKIGIGKEVESAVTEIPRMRVQFAPFWPLAAKTRMGRLIMNRRASRRSAPSAIDTPETVGLGANVTSARANCNAKLRDFCPSTRFLPSSVPPQYTSRHPIPAGSTVTFMNSRQHRPGTLAPSGTPALDHTLRPENRISRYHRRLAQRRARFPPRSP